MSPALTADKVGVIYLALAGYDPESMKQLFERFGQYPAGNTVLDTHPTSPERKNEVSGFPDAAKPHFYQRCSTDECVEKTLSCNAIWCSSEPQEKLKPGGGGGFLAALEAVSDGFAKAAIAKSEEQRKATDLALIAAVQPRLSLRRSRMLPGNRMEMEFQWRGGVSLSALSIELAYQAADGSKRASHYEHTQTLVPNKTFLAVFENVRGKSMGWRVVSVN